MKQVASVCMVAVRQTVWKLLLIIVLMAALEIGLFWHQMPPEPVIPSSDRTVHYYSDGDSYSYSFSYSTGLGFDQALDSAGFAWVLRGALVALCVVQVLQGSDSNGKLSYTLRRLPMGERAVTTLWAAVHMVSYWILWAAQLAVVLVCWMKYTVSYPTHAMTLELFTKFYSSEFLHGLIPLQNYVGAAANILMFLVFGLGAAYCGFQIRAGRKAMLPVILISVSMNWITSDYRDDIVNELSILFYGITFVYMIWKIWVRDYEEI